MKSRYLFLIVLILCSYQGYSQSFKKVFKLVSATDTSDSPILIKLSHKVRLELRKTGSLSFINWRKDSLWIMESFVYEAGTLYGKIWNKKGSVCYVYKQELDTGDKYDHFTKFETSAVESWNEQAIRQQEQTQGIMIHGSNIYATNVAISKKKVSVRRMNFRTLFNRQRDMLQGNADKE